MNRVQNTKIILWSITGLAAAVGITRFIFGLGATTNLTDATPWGLWIGFDVMAGVALAAGGFVMTAFFYVFKQEKFHALVRPAVLTAFLGYLAVVFGLLFDLGLPWNIWHMMIYWNPNSPLFEVGWCVMLYTTVLLLEFSPIPLEETSRYARVRNMLLKFRFPLVLLGIMLSTLHQSSLGSLFLIMPYKLHALWYSPILPILFFVSAVALGLMMVSLESLISHWLYRRGSEANLVAGLGKAAVWVLSVYLVIKLGDILAAGEIGLMFSGTWESNLFMIEILISTLIPIVLLAIPKTRHSTGGQWAASSLVVFGMVFNRMNIGGLAMLGATGDSYVPSWMEVSISLGVVSAVALVFLFGVEKLRIWDERPRDPEGQPESLPKFDYASNVWLGTPPVAARTKYSLAFLLAFALGFALMPQQKIEGRGVEIVPAQKARGGDTLYVDGNRNAYGSVFDHVAHVDSLGQDSSCDRCHHMNLPQDKQSGCWECHRFMYTPTDVFDHDWHSAIDGAGIRCDDCHTPGVQRTKESAHTCEECHADLMVAGSPIKVERFAAPSYVDAMHGTCAACHRERANRDSLQVATFRCPTCHVSPNMDYLRAEAQAVRGHREVRPVVVPAITLETEETPR